MAMSAKSEAGIARLLTLVDTLAVTMAQGFANIDVRLTAVEGNVATLTCRMDANEQAISRLRNDIDRRFDRMDERFDGMDRRFDAIDIRFERLEGPKRKRDR